MRAKEKEEMKKNLIIIVLLISFNLCGTVGFVVNSISESLSRIDFETGEVDNAFCALGSMPNRVALTEDYAYVVNSGDNSVQKIDIETGSTVSNIYIGASSNPYDIVIDGSYAYVSGGLTNSVYKVNLDTDLVEGSVVVGGNPAGMVVYNNKLYVCNSDYASGYANCSVSVIDLASFTVEDTVPVETNPQFIAEINDNIHISCGGNWSSIFGKICILDPSTNSITNILDIGGATSNFAITPENVVYVADGSSSALYAYYAESLEIIYNSTNPFTPGGSTVAANDEFFAVLGGDWINNFTVRTYDFEENLLNEYTVGLCATDIKLLCEGTSVNEEQVTAYNYHLSNYPNPFNPAIAGAGRSQITTILFSLNTENTESTELVIHNLKGQKVRTLNIENCKLNIGKTVWDGTDENNQPVNSGVYFYYLILDGKIVAAKKMLLLR